MATHRSKDLWWNSRCMLRWASFMTPSFTPCRWRVRRTCSHGVVDWLRMRARFRLRTKYNCNYTCILGLVYAVFMITKCLSCNATMYRLWLAFSLLLAISSDVFCLSGGLELTASHQRELEWVKCIHLYAREFSLCCRMIFVTNPRDSVDWVLTRHDRDDYRLRNVSCLTSYSISSRLCKFYFTMCSL